VVSTFLPRMVLRRLLKELRPQTEARADSILIAKSGAGGEKSGMGNRSEQREALWELPGLSSNRVEILECTLRDGSYAVDFKFTEHDTDVLTGTLGRLGFRWIEVGHGLGLGAAKAGKGTMPASDERLIESAKAAAPHARIGCFFIPGIGTMEQMKSARAAGLDFVRIGYNAPEIEKAYPYLSYAREIGLLPCLNFMKTYGVTPERFGELAKGGEDAGAEVVYCVDSAGSMFPEDVRKYVGAARERCECTIGFHGHSNLQFAVANSVEAFRSGARLIDTTLFGLGRSAGNVPTEIAIAVFKRLGVETGLDLFEVMDAAEEFLGPLMSQMQMYDMMSVAMGYSQFHSSFLPKVAAAAKRHHVPLRRLVVTMAELDPVDLDEEALERVAKSLPKAAANRSSNVLTSFRADGISQNSISSSLAAVDSLVKGMTTTCAKRRARPVLELVASELPSPDLVLADIVSVEDFVVMGRVTYGSFETLEQILRQTKGSISFYLVDLDGGAWGAELPSYLKEIPGAERMIPIRSRRLVANYLEEVLMATAQRYGDFSLLVYGSPGKELLQYCSETFRNVVVYGALAEDAPANCIEISDFSDRMHVDLGVTASLLMCPPSRSDALSIDQLTSSGGVLITVGYFPRLEQDLPGRAFFRLDPNHAYRGQMPRWVAISKLIQADRPRALAAQ
jgi:4-hydroxy 2-oxovalerate aldolase